MKDYFNGAMAENSNNHDIIPSLWKKFHQRIGEVSNRVGKETIGIITVNLESNGMSKENLHENLIYIAGVEVESFEKVPEGFEVFTIPKSKYATYEHVGPVKEIDYTLNYIFGTWLPQSKYISPDQPNFEKFPENYDPNCEKARMEFNLPIV